MNISEKSLALVCASTLANATKYAQTLSLASVDKIEGLEAMAMFLSTISHESGRLATVEENLNYSAQRLTQVWPGRYPTLAKATPYARNPRALANHTYGARMGNRPGTDDGWNFRGRGLKQLTGRKNYTWMSEYLGIDFVTNPDWVALPLYAATTAVAFHTKIGGSQYAARHDFEGYVRAINGGLVGYEDGNDDGKLDDRVELYQYAKQKLIQLGVTQ